MTWNVLKQQTSNQPRIATLVELGQWIAQLEHERQHLDEQLSATKTAQASVGPAQVRRLLLPYVEELEQSIHVLIDQARLLTSLAGLDHPAIGRVQPSLLYCYLLVRNLALALEGVALPIEHIDINQQIEQVIELLDHKIDPDNIKILRNFSAHVLPVAISSVEIKQVFMNIIKNAIEALHGAGKLQITTSKKRNMIVVQVQDSGVGIAAENREKIFRLSFSTKGKGTNSGVGLYAVRSIVQRAGGRIGIASAALNEQGNLDPWQRGLIWIAPWTSSGTIIQVELPIAQEGTIDDQPAADSRR
jgi:signal transduction histidine kinase